MYYKVDDKRSILIIYGYRRIFPTKNSPVDKNSSQI